MIPAIPRPRSLTATRTSTGLAVAQRIVQTSGIALTGIQDGDRETAAQHNQECVPSTDGLGASHGEANQLSVVA